MQVDLTVFANPSILVAALLLTSVAIVGKLICGWCFTSGTKINRAIIGFGMVPRGEVGLIFATVGKSIGVVDDRLYAITVIVVILTTLIPPPVLNFLIKSQPKEEYL
jgi:Kef-type K+ transport system membrane component KefB